MKRTSYLKDNLPELTQEETDNLNRTTSIKEIESELNNLPNKAPDPDGFCGEFYQTFMEEIIPVLYNLLQKIQAERILPNLF